MWSAINAFIVKELKLTFRSKASIFWIIAWPAIWLLMTAYVFVPPAVGQPMTLKVGVVNYDVGSTSPFNGTTLIQILNESEYRGAKLFQVKVYENETLMLEDIRRGRLDGGFTIPEGFGKNIIFGQARLKVHVGARSLQSAQIAESILRGFIQGLNNGISMRKINETLRYIEIYSEKYMPKNLTIPVAGNRSWIEFMRDWMIGLASPINASFQDVKPKAFVERSSILGWQTFGAIGMSLLYSGLIIGSTMAVREKEAGTLRRILASPATSTDMLVGKTLSGLITLGIMSAIIVILGVYPCGAKIIWSPMNPAHWLAMILLILVSIMVIGIGMILSLIARTTESASNLSVVLGLMLAFIGGIWFPKSWLPTWMRFLADIFPATWAIDGMRSALVYGATAAELMPTFLKVLAAAIISYLIGVFAYKKTLRKYVIA
ncbi:hypothetical protein DRO64_08030 [Candidatus Bathyarchaeota archaeon]|nr:MAG: hypothetical protein DRO64_08030 [Candidatus Bathyarchaeota archaeon]